MAECVDVIIIGAGVVGCAIARELSRCDISVTVLERSDDVGNATSKANTAILHTGFDCEPGSLESRLVSSGYRRLLAFAESSGIAVEKTGAILVAWSEDQLAQLPKLRAKAEANGYDKVRIISASEITALEPHLGDGVLGGLAVPDEFIIDPWSPVIAFATQAQRGGVAFVFNAEVTAASRSDGIHLLETSQGSFRSTWVINAAGLYSDVINGFCGHDEFTITPRRGELIVFDKLARSLVSSIILPVPTQTTKGVLVAPTVYGNVLLGPTADDVEDKQATATTEDGFTRLLEAGQRIMPELIDEEITASYAGLRAASQHRDYQIHLHADEHYVCVGGIRSTGLTASMAIGDYIAELLEDHGLAPRAEEPPTITMPPLGETQVRPFSDSARIKRDPLFGEILCHCEYVTAGEIRDAATGPLGAKTVEGLRRRTRAMNGRCQGFYCSAEIMNRFDALFEDQR
jgi:glycerol-3-phosphate dehydrogenase